ncbi:MAG: hypothetical protein V5A39_00710 [Haloarculaceae archaeon]
MPEISISEDQSERLEGIRRDVEDAFVDTYGHTRIEDALEYLLDTYTPPEESDSNGAYEQIATATYSELQHVAGEIPEVPGSGLDADEMRGKLLGELGAEEFAARLEATATNGDSEETDGAESTPDEETDDVDPGPDEETDDVDPGPDEETIEANSVVKIGTADTEKNDDDTPSSTGEESESRIATAGNPVAAANQLLREHDDKWRESGGDAPYEVDLPDGTTASARTRDDVRQLLFRHY